MGYGVLMTRSIVGVYLVIGTLQYKQVDIEAAIRWMSEINYACSTWKSERHVIGLF